MPHGGKRAGAGRPRKEVKAWQSVNLSIFQERFSAADVAEIAETVKGHMKAGQPDALKLFPYVFGPAPKEITITDDSVLSVRFVNDWRGKAEEE